MYDGANTLQRHMISEVNRCKSGVKLIKNARVYLSKRCMVIGFLEIPVYLKLFQNHMDRLLLLYFNV